jgi:S1-C subfamily serine protease
MISALLAPLANETSALVDWLRRSVVIVHGGQGHGSGVVWTSQGLIVTNDHVTSRGRADIETWDGRHLHGTVLARDPGNDLAAIQVEDTSLPAAAIGDSRAVRVGQLIVAIGHPLGVRGTATLGFVSAVDRVIQNGGNRRDIIHADVELLPGNSGGPLADIAGRVIGIASMIVSPGIAIAVPSHVVGEFVGTIRAPGFGARAA